MAIKKPAPKQFAPEVAEAITQAAATQSITTTKVTSYDPKNFPVFSVPVNERVLAYIPNHTIQNPDGTISLRQDKFPAHPVIDGRAFYDVRCINGAVNADPQLNWDGSCPLCEGLQDVWKLYNEEYKDLARSRGIQTDAPEAQELLKNERIDMLKSRVIKEPEFWLTFPIVVIDCEEKDGVKTTTPKLTADGQLSYRIMWYSIRERTYLEKWEAGYDSIEGEAPSTPAGLWAVLNFTYTPKSGNCDKMGSAKALKVTFKTMDSYAKWAEFFDKATEEWTPAKAQEVVVLDVIRSKEETAEVADSILKPVRDKLALRAMGSVGVATPVPAVGAGAPAGALAQFGQPAVSTTAPAEGAAPAPAVGATAPITGEMPSAGIQ